MTAPNKAPTPKAAKQMLVYQTHVLAERYFDVFLADWTALFFLIFQPLAVAVCAGMIWQGTTPGKTLYFVLIFSAIFFGCVNACREIVKERAIFARERLVGLKIPPYILSKIGVLAAMGLGQTLLFYLGVRYFLVLDGNPALLVLTLYLSLLAGTGLGLVISALVTSDVMALALVPVCLIPQLLFSELVMPDKTQTGLVAALERITIVRWSYQAIEQVIAATPVWGDFSAGLFWLVVITVTLCLLSATLVKLKDL